MSQHAAALGAMTSSFVAFGLAAAWYAWPWMRKHPPRVGLTLLLWIHVFRYVALQIFSSVNAGYDISHRLRGQIVHGGLVGAAAALVAIALLRRGLPSCSAPWPLPAAVARGGTDPARCEGAPHARRLTVILPRVG